MIKFLIWPEKAGHDDLGPVIKFLTRGDGTHAAFLRSNGLIAENFYPHVRQREWKPGEPGVVEAYRLRGMTEEGSAKLEAWIDRELKLSIPYSIADLFRYALNLPPIVGRGCFCSQWVLRGIKTTQPESIQPLVRLEYDCFASPTMLRSSPALVRVRA
ncbi:MAG: hypothetical protein KGL39_50580 [Patescibacteria group bacterium]|nr:hypothetical protein [Patescibacteria group bacterium]